MASSSESEREALAREIAYAIDAALPRCKDLSSLGRELYRQGISMEMHRRCGTGEVYGLFSMADDRPPGTSTPSADQR